MKKYLIALLGIAAILNSNTGIAQTTRKHHKTATPVGCPPNTDTRHHVAKHHTKRKPVKPMAMTEETINVDSRFKTAVVEINKGKVYFNDSLITTVKSPKWEDHRIVINYLTPPPPVAAVEQLKTNTYTGNMGEQGWLGVYTCNDCEGGVMVEGTVPCSPADKAGLHSGDVITKINDHEINSKSDLTSTLSDMHTGDNVSITYEHYGSTKTLETELAKRDTKKNCGCSGRERREYSSCNSCRARRW
jgi:hypothetical protein